MTNIEKEILVSQLLEYPNKVRKLFGKEPMSLSNPSEILEYVECEMSPENLSADGERPNTEIRAMVKRLNTLKKLAEEAMTKEGN